MPNVAVPSLTPLLILSQASFFSGIGRDQLLRVAGLGQLEEYGQDREIYNLGDPARNLYVLVDGMVRFAIGRGSRNASGGDILNRGEVFGWAALTPGNRRIATATCLTPCTVLALDGARLMDLMEQDNRLGFQIMKQLNHLVTGTLTAFVAG